jgi:ribosome-associated protein
MPDTVRSHTLAAPLLEVLDDLKAQQVRVMDVSHLTTLMDLMIVASGRSDRHVRAIAAALVERCKALGQAPLGVEGEEGGEWMLVDAADVVVHIMLPRVREFYDIETLWDMPAAPERSEERQL